MNSIDVKITNGECGGINIMKNYNEFINEGKKHKEIDQRKHR
jgi:hypothetical protein